MWPRRAKSALPRLIPNVNEQYDGPKNFYTMPGRRSPVGGLPAPAVAGAAAAALRRGHRPALCREGHEDERQLSRFGAKYLWEFY